jgi:hypothetical protein
LTKRWLSLTTIFVLAVLPVGGVANSDDPKPKPENTIHVELAAAVNPQTFSRPVHFYVTDVVDRSGSAQPMMLLRERGGIFVDRLPALIVKESIVASLKSANLLASDEAQADIILKPYLFHFGLESGSGTDLFGKVEFAVTVKDVKSGESKEVNAAGTSIAALAMRKKNIEKNMAADMDAALQAAVENLVRGVQLRDAVNSFSDATAAGTSAASPEAGSTAPGAAPSAAPAAAADSSASSSTGQVDKTFVWNIKTTEPKHFTRAEGVELSPAFSDYLYAELRAELTKTKKYGQVIGEGEAVSPADVSDSVVVEGILTEYKKGSVAKAEIIGFGTGLRSLKMTVTMARRSNEQSVVRIELHIKASPRWTEQVMARVAAKEIANDLRKHWEKEKNKS